MQIPFSDKPVQYYNLDMIISVGYRVNSKRATNFRIWATQVVKQYMLKGYVVNHNAVSEQKYEELKNVYFESAMASLYILIRAWAELAMSYCSMDLT